MFKINKLVAVVVLLAVLGSILGWRILGNIRRIYPRKLNKGNKVSGKKLLILWDNPGWHWGSAVTDYLKRDRKIKVIYFPKYSPEENPQEHVWKEGRAKVTHNTLPQPAGL